MIRNNLRTRKDYRDYHKVVDFFVQVSEHMEIGRTVSDLCCGNGMLGFYYLERNPKGHVNFVDVNHSNRFRKLAGSIPTGNYEFTQRSLDDLNQTSGNLLAIHACNDLTDKVIDLGLRENKPFAVMPCCHTTSLVLEYGLYLPPQFRTTFGLVEYIDTARVKRIEAFGREGHLTRTSSGKTVIVCP